MAQVREPARLLRRSCMDMEVEGLHCDRLVTGPLERLDVMKQKGRQGLRPLNLVAYGLVSCAILFSLYCALHVNWRFDSSNAPAGSIRSRNLRAGEQQGAGPQKEGDSNSDLPAAGNAGGMQAILEKQIAKQNEITIEALTNIQKHLHELQDGQAHAPPATNKIVTSAASVHNPRKYHLVTTCQGFANHWQARVHYYWCVVQLSRSCREPETACW